ncbi:hypothetical protein EVAR_12520_1 [Eumeta japonica]|uniref:Uncharacterized protein n=1 Tax=Eumeta variegata TaxID=151549 RepID=A0A4C1TPQ4_EUMVA|nr:hypothetical protein EVAR_12520_1 [Eumeta japonica]
MDCVVSPAPRCRPPTAPVAVETSISDRPNSIARRTFAPCSVDAHPTILMLEIGRLGVLNLKPSTPTRRTAETDDLTTYPSHRANDLV